MTTEPRMNNLTQADPRQQDHLVCQLEHELREGILRAVVNKAMDPTVDAVKVSQEDVDTVVRQVCDMMHDVGSLVFPCAVGPEVFGTEGPVVIDKYPEAKVVYPDDFDSSTGCKGIKIHIVTGKDPEEWYKTTHPEEYEERVSQNRLPGEPGPETEG